MILNSKKPNKYCHYKYRKKSNQNDKLLSVRSFEGIHSPVLVNVKNSKDKK